MEWKDIVKNILKDVVAETNDDPSEVKLQASIGAETTALKLDLLVQNLFPVVIMPGVEDHGIRWIVIAKIHDFNLMGLPVNYVLAMLKNPTPEAIRQLKTPSK